MQALVDYFLKIDGIEGESPDKTYPGWIQLERWQWAEENSGRWGVGSGGGTGKVEMKDFEFRMVTNKASPKLFLMCATGQHLDSAKLVCRKSGQGQQDFMIVTFSNCLVSSFRTLGNVPLVMGQPTTTGDTAVILPMDEIKINFARIQIEYHEQLNDGTMGPAINAGYDLKLSTPI
jgi:type VI secretion system secreted protein Hcp